jgi:hypothetical protein
MAGETLETWLRGIEARVAHLEASGAASLIRGTCTAYDADTHTATVTVGGVSYTGVPVDAGHAPHIMRHARNVGATVGIVGFSAATPSNGCIIYVYSATPPPDPLDAVTGHKHRGITDDGPRL